MIKLNELTEVGIENIENFDYIVTVASSHNKYVAGLAFDVINNQGVTEYSYDGHVEYSDSEESYECKYRVILEALKYTLKLSQERKLKIAIVSTEKLVISQIDGANSNQEYAKKYLQEIKGLRKEIDVTFYIDDRKSLTKNVGTRANDTRNKVLGR